MSFSHKVVEHQAGATERRHVIVDMPNTVTVLETGDYDIKFISYDVAACDENINYLKIFNDTNPTVGTDQPDLVIPLLKSNRNVLTGFVSDCFTSGMSVLATETLASDEAQVVIGTGLPKVIIGVVPSS